MVNIHMKYFCIAPKKICFTPYQILFLSSLHHWVQFFKTITYSVLLVSFMIYFIIIIISGVIKGFWSQQLTHIHTEIYTNMYVLYSCRIVLHCLITCFLLQKSLYFHKLNKPVFIYKIFVCDVILDGLCLFR